MALNIVGGTYFECCIDPAWNELYGSGLRAAHALSSQGEDIILHTSVSEDLFEELLYMTNAMGVGLKVSKAEEITHFKYDYPLANPEFYLPSNKNKLDIVKADLVLQFGMVEGNSVIHADKVVYDPQSPSSPQSFWSNGSKANELIWVANFQEVRLFTGLNDLREIKEYLLNSENVHAAIIKNGTDGAIIIQKDVENLFVPAYKTNSVWPIGTGDIFSSSFAYNYLINNLPLLDAACLASLNTAFYSETTILPLPLEISTTRFQKFSKKASVRKNVYLAGPFFTTAQRWIISELRDQLMKFGLNVFSPFHDVGLGKPEVVVPQDIMAIKSADLIVALIDGLDAGTLFEIGYGIALDIPVIAFVENEKPESLTMLIGSGCQIETDFSTLIYKSVWEAYK